MKAPQRVKRRVNVPPPAAGGGECRTQGAVLTFISRLTAQELLGLERVIGLITGHGHLKKHLHRLGILQEDPFCRICDEQDERYTIFGSLYKVVEFPQEDLIRCFLAICGTAEIIDW
ncbi:hypothetical protein J6590_033789 [Homalodisca vitripennis]|nr:hypothetical protein J6590_033789 [Homalodisca vitripennis]